MIEHPLSVRKPPVVEDARAGLRRSEWGRHRPASAGFGQPTGARAVDLAPVALEAERVVAIGADFLAIPGPGLPLLTRAAQDPVTFRPSATLATRHRHPPDPVQGDAFFSA
jgi:hypothetical protein